VFLVVAESQEPNPVSLEAFPSEVHPQSERTTQKCNKLRTIQGSNISKQPIVVHWCQLGPLYTMAKGHQIVWPLNLIRRPYHGKLMSSFV
jgi:hypothetical protein